MTPGAEGGPDPTDGRYERLSPGPGRAGNTRLPGVGTVTELNTRSRRRCVLSATTQKLAPGVPQTHGGRVGGHRVRGRCRGSGPGRGTRVSAH